MSLETWFKDLAGEFSCPTLSPREAAARILELQKIVKLDSEGWTVRDYINYGRR